MAEAPKGKTMEEALRDARKAWDREQYSDEQRPLTSVFTEMKMFQGGNLISPTKPYLELGLGFLKKLRMQRKKRVVSRQDSRPFFLVPLNPVGTKKYLKILCYI
jgi:hypothetical protein